MTIESAHTDRGFMRVALDQAREAAERGDPAFGAVLVRGEHIVARAGSREVSDHDPTAHDGILLVREACRALRTAVLDDCVFYGTAEPCPMCAAALLSVRIARVVIGASGPPLAAVLGPRALRLEEIDIDYTARPQILRGTLADEGLALLRRTA